MLFRSVAILADSTNYGQLGRADLETALKLKNVIVEIWQCDNNGAYLHSKTGNADKRDRHFQGFGRFVTGRAGEYGFRTIRPVAYPGRTPHIHVAVKVPGQEKFVTQCYVKGHPGNEKDGVLRSIRDDKARESVLVDFMPIPDSRLRELTARFDIVLGVTPQDEPKAG